MSEEITPPTKEDFEAAIRTLQWLSMIPYSARSRMNESLAVSCRLTRRFLDGFRVAESEDADELKPKP
jgi:hypothetical protein